MSVPREARFRVVQPYGRDPFRESTVVSVHATADAAFSKIDRLSAQMTQSRARFDAVELVVIDFEKQFVVRRSNPH